MLKRKWTKGSGSQAPAPEEKSERGSPVEQLRERSREGRKETNRKLSTGTGRDAWKQAERRVDKVAGVPAVRGEREEGKGRNRG